VSSGRVQWPLTDVGGLSFQSTQYGWASTHILEYEIVLANGTIAIASPKVNSDLHRALQAGGNLFGVVTAFTLRTFPGNAIWGGIRSYSADKTMAMLAAIRDFTEYYPDPKAAIIATCESAAYGSVNLWTVFFYYDGIRPPANIFENFTRLAHATDNTGPKLMSELLFENNLLAVINNTYLTVGRRKRIEAC
jgi:FAD/FMN-containing dehydrogenase